MAITDAFTVQDENGNTTSYMDERDAVRNALFKVYETGKDHTVYVNSRPHTMFWRVGELLGWKVL